MSWIVRAYREQLLSGIWPSWHEFAVLAVYCASGVHRGGLFFRHLKGGFADYDGRFYEQEVLGEYPMELTAGRVYFAFSRDGNVAEVKLAEGRPLLWALDFNVDPMSSVVAQVEGDEVKVLDEIVLSRASTYDACEEFGSRFADHAAGLVIYADAKWRAAADVGDDGRGDSETICPGIERMATCGFGSRRRIRR